MDVTSRKMVKPVDRTARTISGTAPEGESELWTLVTGQRLQLVELHLYQGFFRAEHHHPEHESIGYVISGQLQMGINGKEYILEAGDAWHHRLGVPHWTRALEDTRAVEIHAPPRPDLSSGTPA